MAASPEDGYAETRKLDERIAADAGRVYSQMAVEHAMMGLACAVEDMNQAIIHARTPALLKEMQSASGEAITRLCTISDITVTLAKYFGQQVQ